MARLLHNLTVRQRLLTAVAVILVILVIAKFARVPMDRLPLRENVADQEKRLRGLQEKLAGLQAGRQEHEAALAKLREQAEPFWQVKGTAPILEVPVQFEKLARKAQVQIRVTGKPRNNKILDLHHVHAIDFRVQLSAKMQEVSRLLAQLERSGKLLGWHRCNIQPDNLRTPQKVTVDGEIRALVLSPEATKFLAGESGES